MNEFTSTLWTVIQAARGGDESAAHELVRRYRGPIVSYCVRRGLGAEAEDVAQEVLLRLFTGGVLLRADPAHGRFRSLLLAVTRHTLSDHLDRREAARRGAGRVEPLGERDVAAPEPDDDFDREWVAYLVQGALARLAAEHPPYHEALRRFLVDGCSYAEVAAALGRSPGEVRNQIFRGRRKLVDYLRAQVRDYSSSRTDYEEELRYLARLLPAAPEPEAGG